MNGDDADSFVLITLGTGVGGGVIIDGKPYRGFNCAGGELGHIIINADGEEQCFPAEIKAAGKHMRLLRL